MGLFKKKEYEVIKVEPPIDTLPTPDVLKADLETKKETRQIVVKDVTKEFEAFRAEMAQIFVTQDDASDAIMKLHEKTDAIAEQLNKITAYLKGQQRPNL